MSKNHADGAEVDALLAAMPDRCIVWLSVDSESYFVRVAGTRPHEQPDMLAFKRSRSGIDQAVALARMAVAEQS